MFRIVTEDGKTVSDDIETRTVAEHELCYFQLEFEEKLFVEPMYENLPGGNRP